MASLERIMTSFQLRQSILLLITAVIWGSAFVAQSIGMDSVGPFTFTTSRTLLGAIVLLPLVVWRRTALVKTDPQEALRRSSRGYRRALLMGGLSCGLCLFAGEAFQQFGLVFHTEAGKAGFITSLYIVLVPVMSTFLGRRSNLLMWTSVAVACAGLWYLCVPPEGISIALGDFFVFLCAFAFAVHILVIGHFVKTVDAVELSVSQFLFASLLGFIATALFETPTYQGWIEALPAILFAGILSNGVAYTLQVVGQRGMNETAASLIMSLESVFSVIAGWLVLGQVLTVRELAGCVVMGCAVVLAQIPVKPRRSSAG